MCKVQRARRAFTPDKNENERGGYPPRNARGDVNASYTSKSDHQEVESTNLDASNVIRTIPRERLTRSKMTPRRQARMRRKRRRGGKGGIQRVREPAHPTRAIKNLFDDSTAPRRRVYTVCTIVTHFLPFKNFVSDHQYYIDN